MDTRGGRQRAARQESRQAGKLGGQAKEEKQSMASKSGRPDKSDSQPGNAAGAELWPREEARRLAQRVAAYEPARPVIFASGFGPSGLPHLGTMAEILRPSFVRKAFALIEASRPSRLIVFIDDLDGLRKVPENVPNREATEQYLGIPVSKIPDPFGCCASFADHMIGLLGGFLAPVEVEYELMRSAEMYSSGRFDEGLKLILDKHAEITAIIAPTLREENRAGWSPFMPICPNCGQVVERTVSAYHPERASIEFICEKSAGGRSGCGFRGEQSVLGGKGQGCNGGWMGRGDGACARSITNVTERISPTRRGSRDKFSA